MSSMPQAYGAYVKDHAIQLPEDINIPDGSRVTVVVGDLTELIEDLGWSKLAEISWEKDWDSEGDAIYDNWREIYGVPKG